MRNSRHTGREYFCGQQEICLFTALQVDLLVLQLVTDQQSHAFSLPSWEMSGAQIWFAEEIVLNYLIYRKKNLLPNHGIFLQQSHQVKTLTSCSTCVALLLQKLRQDTYATSLQTPTSKPQGADHQHFWCTNTAPAAPLEHPKLEHHFCLRNNTRTQKSNVLLHFFWLKQAQILEASLEKAQYFYCHLMKIMNKAKHTNLFITYTDYTTNTNKEYQSVSFQCRHNYFSTKSTLQS